MDVSSPDVVLGFFGEQSDDVDTAEISLREEASPPSPPEEGAEAAKAAAAGTIR